MPPGKRTGSDQPLTEHDVAERLDKAALRTLRILMEARQIPGLQDAVKGSRYLGNTTNALAAELEAWGFAANPMPGQFDTDERDRDGGA